MRGGNTEEATDVAELVDGKISSQGGLFAFLAHDTNPHISRLNHGHVITAIPYRCGL